MYVDALLLFSDAQAVTAAAASTNYLDQKSARDLGVGKPLYIVIVCDVAMTDDSSNSTLTVALQGDSSTTFTPDGSQTLVTIPALTAIGTRFVIPIAPEMTKFQYLQLYYTPNNGNLSTGSFTAFITDTPQLEAVYADNITIS
jgi:hypothetical protein